MKLSILCYQVMALGVVAVCLSAGACSDSDCENAASINKAAEAGYIAANNRAGDLLFSAAEAGRRDCVQAGAGTP